MFINVTAKARNMFRNYPVVKDPEKAKEEALANPFYSWHCTYFTVQRHRMLCFINDASLLSLILPNITTKDYSHLQEKFEKELTQQLQLVGLNQQQINQYIRKAGPWVINKTVNRQVLGELTQMTRQIKSWLGGGKKQKLSVLENQFKNFNQSQNSLRSVDSLENTPNRVRPTSNNKEDSLMLQNVVQQLRYFASHDKQFREDDQFDDHVDKLVELNSELIDAFVKDNSGQLSNKTLHRHKNHLTFYLNEFLAYRMLTIFNDESCDLEEPLYHGFSVNEMKETRAALKKLYQFLRSQKQIDEKEWNHFKSLLNHQLKANNDDFSVPEPDDFSALFDSEPLPSMPAEVEALVKSYCTAAANLYGLISCDQLYRIMVKQNPVVQINPDQLVAWFDKQQQAPKSNNYFVINNVTGIPAVIHPKIYQQNLGQELMSEQIGKPFYLPAKEQLLKYQESSYLEETVNVKKYRHFIIQRLGVPRLQANHWVNEIRRIFNEQFTHKFGENIQTINEEMLEQNYGCSDKSEVEEWLAAFMNLYHDTRLFTNRGLTPTEVEKEPSFVAELNQKHKLTPSIVKGLESARIDPMDVVMIIASLNGISERQKEKLINQVADLPIPSLD